MSVNVRLSSELSLIEQLNLKEETATPILMPSLVESKMAENPLDVLFAVQDKDIRTIWITAPLACRSNTSIFTLVPGLGGGFDVPHAADVSISNTEGSGVGSLVEPPVAGSRITDSVKESDVVKAIQCGSVHLSLEFQLAEQTTVVWETVVVGRNLYLFLGGNLPKGSKEAFVSLLEYAEEVLGCANVVVCFKKERADRALLIRTFMFLGFQPIPPGHDHFAPMNGELFYMMYEID